MILFIYFCDFLPNLFMANSKPSAVQLYPIKQQLPTREGMKTITCFGGIWTGESTILPLPHAWAHRQQWFSSDAVIDRGESMSALSPRARAILLSSTDGRGIIRIRTFNISSGDCMFQLHYILEINIWYSGGSNLQIFHSSQMPSAECSRGPSTGCIHTDAS